jgi:aldose 1-epimerase
MTVSPPSGVQFEIVHGEQRATIVEVGGGIRAYSAGGRDVLDPYPLDAMCDGAHGAPLIPWPNRLAHGSYSFDGVDYQLAITEPERGNAIHGLLRWRGWRATEREPDRVVMGIRLHPMAGYPFTLDVRVSYALAADGLTVTTSATNVGDHACPYGEGQHPYLSAGGGLIDDCRLELPAATRVLVDEQRMLPQGREPVAGTDADFREPRRIGEQQIDVPYTDLDRRPDGVATARLTGPDGATAELWVDEQHTLLEVYTGDQLAPSRRRRGLGMEPMTCPPNALQSGEGVVRLEPGETHVARWGARLS